MSNYRFYLIAHTDSRAFLQNVDCATDLDATVHATEMLGTQASVEVWQDRRFVGEFGQLSARRTQAQPEFLGKVTEELTLFGRSKSL